MKLTENFKLQEFACKDGSPVPKKYYPNVIELAQNLEVLRNYIGESLFVSGSGYRTKSHNTKVGGAPKSLHLTASAADISARNYSPMQLAEIIETLIDKGKMKQGGLGVYTTFVHYDIRGIRARW